MRSGGTVTGVDDRQMQLMGRIDRYTETPVMLNVKEMLGQAYDNLARRRFDGLGPHQDYRIALAMEFRCEVQVVKSIVET